LKESKELKDPMTDLTVASEELKEMKESALKLKLRSQR
jgi:hypothetical protein